MPKTLPKFSDCEKYALRLPVPALGLTALPEDATVADYEQRAREISYDLIRDSEGERGLAATLQKLGAIP